MSEVRIVEETTCERCGEMHVGARIMEAGCFGDGGLRRVLRETQPDYEAAEVHLTGLLHRLAVSEEEAVKPIVDAALAGRRIVEETE